MCPCSRRQGVSLCRRHHPSPRTPRRRTGCIRQTPEVTVLKCRYLYTNSMSAHPSLPTMKEPEPALRPANCTYLGNYSLSLQSDPRQRGQIGPDKAPAVTRRKSRPVAPKPVFSETHSPDTGGEQNCSGEGELNLPSIPEETSGCWRNEPGNAVLGGLASVEPLYPGPVPVSWSGVNMAPAAK